MDNYLFIDEAFKSYVWRLIREHDIDLYGEVICYAETSSKYKLPDNEYALVKGPESMLTCSFHNVKGQVFTIYSKNFRGRVIDILNSDLRSYFGRSLFYAFANTLFRFLGIVDKTLHCTGDAPVKCGLKLYNDVLRETGKLLHIGYQPGHVKVLTQYMRDNLLITDLRNDTVWRTKYGRLIYDGFYNNIYLHIVDTVLLTASSIINKTFWDIISKTLVLGKRIIIYGVSAPAITYFINKHLGFNIEYYCPYGV